MGTLERDRLELVAEASEPVIARPFEEGDYVRAGSLLVALDPARIDAQVAQAESARARAAARLAELESGPRTQRIAEARARLAGAEGRLATARSDLERAEGLFGRDALSRGRLDGRRARFDEARAARNAARAGLDSLLEGTRQEQIVQARASLAQAEARLAEARVRRERLDVRAPTDGWLDALPFELGERPPPGGVLAVLLANAAPYARVYIPAAIRVRVKAGTPAHVHIDGIDTPLPARVRSVASDASFTPYFALTEHDRGRLVYLAKVDLLSKEARELPTGGPVEVNFDQWAEAADTKKTKSAMQPNRPEEPPRAAEAGFGAGLKAPDSIKSYQSELPAEPGEAGDGRRRD